MDPTQAQVPSHTTFTLNFSNHHQVEQQQQQQQQQQQSRTPPQSTPLIKMNGEELPVTAEETPVWATPTSQTISHTPTSTKHEGFHFGSGEGYGSLTSPWDSSSLGMQTPSETMSRPVSMHQDFYPMSAFEDNSSHHQTRFVGSAMTMGPDPWMTKPTDDSFDMHGVDSDMGIGQAFTSDDAIPILDLRFDTPDMDNEMNSMDSNFDPRRISGSSFTMSTSGGMSDFGQYEDFSSAMSEAPSFISDYPPTSNRNSMMSSTQLSPVASPRMTPHGRSELARTHSRGRGTSPSPRPARSAPYQVDSSARSKRWSTGSYGPNSNRRPSPFVYNHNQDAFGPRLPSRNSSPPTSNSAPLPLNFGNLQAVQANPYLTSHPPALFRNSMILPSQLPSHGCVESHSFEPPAAPLLSHGLFRMLQSNAEPHSLHGHHHYTDLSDPPDLFSSLHEEQIPPPPEDMNPEDPDMVPHEQELRFEGDLYTPKWVRGHGNKREGWCGICKPGRWLVLKNSAFWYDKSFTHGISAATGSPFQEPQEYRRMDGNPDVWEGLCGSCNDWIALVSSKKKGTTWFRHAYKCHTHPKVKDAPKRRRESSHNRTLAASQMAKPKVVPGGSATPSDSQRPITPQSVSSTAVSLNNTPTSAPAVPPIPSEHLQPPPYPQSGFPNMI